MPEMSVDVRNQQIGSNIRTYRQVRGLTLDQLAEGICSSSQMSKIENGKTYVQRSILKQLAERLETSVEVLETEDALREEHVDQLKLARFALTAGQNEQAFKLAQEVFERSGAFGYSDQQLDAVILKVEVLRALKRYGEAVEAAVSFMKNNQVSEPGKLVQLLCQLGHAYYEKGDLKWAFDSYNRALDEIDGIDADDELKLPVYYDLCHINITMKNYVAALRFGEKANQIAKKQSKHLVTIRTLSMMATAIKYLGNTDMSESLQLQALEITENNSYLFDSAVIRHNLGCLYKEQKQFGEALKCFERARQVFELLGQEQRLIDTELERVDLEFERENFEKSSELLDIQLDKLDKMEASGFLERAKAYKLLAKHALQQNDFERYVSTLKKVSDIYADNGLYLDAYEVALTLGTALEERHDPRAMTFFRQAVDFNEKSILIGLRR